MVVIGVLLGSTTWWLDLTSVVGTFRTRLTLAWLDRIHVVSGVIIAAFAIMAIARWSRRERPRPVGVSA